MCEANANKNWFARRIEKEAKKDVLRFSERLGGAVAILIITLATLFFIAHQIWSTGFFTSKFGLTEMLLFYSSLLYGFVPNSIKCLSDRRNFVRLFEIFGAILTTIALVWVYIVFPFDFSHLVDPLPISTRFLLQWISNNIARFFMILGIIVTPISAINKTILYVSVRKELLKSS
ncbi:hypothetical protein DRO54_00895 [Candidatus Bathyarchaeota archaeon]|nr:MAG: hypothetical protein DRO54_00895 [Candidatus Bathyarchaeota archaeon]